MACGGPRAQQPWALPGLRQLCRLTSWSTGASTIPLPSNGFHSAFAGMDWHSGIKQWVVTKRAPTPRVTGDCALFRAERVAATRGRFWERAERVCAADLQLQPFEEILKIVAWIIGLPHLAGAHAMNANLQLDVVVEHRMRAQRARGFLVGLAVRLLQRIQASDRFSDDIVALLSIPLCFRGVGRYDETAPRLRSPLGSSEDSLSMSETSIPRPTLTSLPGRWSCWLIKCCKA